MDHSGKVRAPGASAGSGKHAIGLVVFGEGFSGRIPLEFSFEHHGDIAEVAEAGAAMANLSGKIRILTGLYTIEKITMLPGGTGKEANFVGFDLGIQDGFWFRLQRSAPGGTFDPAFGPFAADAAAAGIDDQGDAVGIFIFDMILRGGIIDTHGGEFTFALHLNRSGAFGIVGPLGGIQQMGTPIGNHAAGIVEDPAEIPVTARGGIRGIGRGPEPHFIIKPVRDGLGLLVFGIFIGSVNAMAGRQSDLDGFEFADAAVADEFGHPMIDGNRTVFSGGLEDAAVTFDRVAENATFPNSESGFFTANILAGFDGGKRHRHVPMIRRSDHDGVDIIAGNDIAEIIVGGAVFIVVFLVGDFAGSITIVGIHITNREYLRIGLGEEAAQIDRGTVTADADTADGDPIAGGDGAGFPKSGR